MDRQTDICETETHQRPKLVFGSSPSRPVAHKHFTGRPCHTMDLDEIIGPVLGDLKQRLSAALETHVKAQEQLFKSRSRELDERERALLDREKHAQRAGDNHSSQPGSTSERGDKGTSGWQQSFAERSKLFTGRRSESKNSIENPDPVPDGPKEPPARQACFAVRAFCIEFAHRSLISVLLSVSNSFLLHFHSLDVVSLRGVR